jgi:hypothetical protein
MTNIGKLVNKKILLCSSPFILGNSIRIRSKSQNKTKDICVGLIVLIINLIQCYLQPYFSNQLSFPEISQALNEAGIQPISFI